MNKVEEVINIETMIYEIRGCQVMLDSDLAKLYKCKNGTKEINQAVKNNSEKFPERFSWILSNEEEQNLRSKILTSSENHYGGRRYKIRVFTEQGVAMLATILKSKVATNISIQIMDAFVAMRKYITTNNYSQRISHIETKVIEHDNKFNEIFSKLESTPNNHIFFEGQIYDAYSLLVDILNQANNSIIIIDNYIDKKLLDILSKVNKDIIVITKYINNIDLEKYNKQYHNIQIITNTSFHDRFIILDETTLYHCGASFKDLGSKCFAISKLEDKTIVKELINKIKKERI